MSRDTEDTRPWANKADGLTSRLERLAQANRKRPTDAERKLWRHLKHIRTNGTHFRRQVAIGGFIADFACFGSRLVIEVDGGQHCDSAADAARTAALEAQGWRVIRFWNNEVRENLEGVATSIAEALGAGHVVSSCATPTPNPSPQGGGEHVRSQAFQIEVG